MSDIAHNRLGLSEQFASSSEKRGPSSFDSFHAAPMDGQSDITAANRAGRFHVADPELALALAAGALLALGQLLRDQPERDDSDATDQMAEDLLRVYGVAADEAREICRRPLPNLGDQGEPDSAA